MTGHLNKSDTSLWLHNKLGNVNDLWSGGSICSQLNTDVLKNIRDCFPDLQSLVKLKLLCSFLHLPRRNVELWRSELDEIVEVASIDSDQWVSIVGELCKSFPETGNINFNIDENPLVFTELIADLKKSVKKHSDQGILPIESLYLNKNAFAAQIGTQPNPVKHFTLRRKPKSAALRAELLQKSVDVATSSKKNLTTPNTATRYRGSKELNDNTPLKGIPSRTSFGSSSSISTFKTPNPANRSAGSVRNPTRPTIPGVRRDGGIKLLDIGEQPLGRDAKRKKRNQEEAEAKQKENDKTNGQPDSTATPDYALGLTSMVPPSPAPAYTAPATPGPYLGETSTSISTPKPPPPHKEVTIEKTTPVSLASLTPKVKYEPASVKVESPVKSETITSPSIIKNPSQISSSSIIVSPSSTTSISNAPTIAKQQQQQNLVQVTIVPNKQIINQQQPLQQQHQQQQGSITIQPIQQQQVIQQVQRSVTQSQPVPQQNIYPQLHQQQQQQQQPQQVGSAVPSATGSTIPTSTAPRLQLSQKQILEAQELFKNSNTVGKVEKALILSFMGGSRENPCPHLGDIVTIKLSEKEEQIRQPDGTIINVIAENHYQMNYSTGEAKQIKKLRRA